MPDEKTQEIAPPAAAPVTPPPASPPATPATTTESKPEGVYLSRSEYDEWSAEREKARRDLAAKEAERIAAEERAARNALDKGQYEKAYEKLDALTKERESRAIKDRDDSIAAMNARHAAELKAIREERDRLAREKSENEARSRKDALDGAIGRALSEHDLCDGSAEELSELLRSHFVVEADGNSFSTRSADGRPVKDYVAAYLDKKPHHKRSRAGTGGTIPTMPGLAPRHEGQPLAVGPQPGNMGEAAIATLLARKRAEATVASADMSVPMGLRRLAR